MTLNRRRFHPRWDGVTEAQLFTDAWEGVDFDSTLAQYDGPANLLMPGDAILSMLDRVRCWLADGVDVRILTARAPFPGQHHIISQWLLDNGLPILPITDRKDFAMRRLWDDR